MKKKMIILIVSMILFFVFIFSTAFLAGACHPGPGKKPSCIYVSNPYSSNCGPDHYSLVVDGSWDTCEWLTLGDTLYFNYTIIPRVKHAAWHVGYWESEGQGHINESLVIPDRILKASCSTRNTWLLHLRVQRVEGNCWWDDEWNFSVWNPRSRSWETLLLTTGGMDSSFYDTMMEWVIR